MKTGRVLTAGIGLVVVFGVASGLAAGELEAIRQRGGYTLACWVQGGEGDWMIEHVATDPAYRGRGLVQALIAHALDKGLAAGFTRATISFLIGNDPAERAYAKAGFIFADEKRDPQGDKEDADLHGTGLAARSSIATATRFYPSPPRPNRPRLAVGPRGSGAS